MALKLVNTRGETNRGETNRIGGEERVCACVWGRKWVWFYERVCNSCGCVAKGKVVSVSRAITGDELVVCCCTSKG